MPKLCRKIDIYSRAPDGALTYLCSTNQSRTCREALARYVSATGAAPTNLRAYFSKH